MGDRLSKKLVALTVQSDPVHLIQIAFALEGDNKVETFFGTNGGKTKKVGRCLSWRPLKTTEDLRELI